MRPLKAVRAPPVLTRKCLSVDYVKRITSGIRNLTFQRSEIRSQGQIGAVSKRFQMIGFKGPSQEKRALVIFRFGYAKASNDPAAAGVPDPVGSEVFVLQKLFVRL